MAKTEFVLRPFEGLPGEGDWVAMREILPSATAKARTVKAHGGVDVLVCTILPEGLVALHRRDGTILLAVQDALTSDDTSRDLAAALLSAIDAEPGTGIGPQAVDSGTPRLQEVLDLAVPFEAQVHQGYEYWVDAATERDRELEERLAEAAEGTIHMERVAGVSGAFWADMGREYVRWVREEDEDALVDALARLQAKRQTSLEFPSGDQGKFLGMFRAAGLAVPVWELPAGTGAAGVAEPLAELGDRLAAALAENGPLSADERRARAGIVSRQVTLR